MLQKKRVSQGVCVSWQHPQERSFSGELVNEPSNYSCSKGGLSSSLGLWERFLTLTFPLKTGNMWHKRAVREWGLDFCHLRKEISKGSCQVSMRSSAHAVMLDARGTFLAPWWLLLARPQPGHGFSKFQFVTAKPTLFFSLLLFPSPFLLLLSPLPAFLSVISASAAVVHGGNWSLQCPKKILFVPRFCLL